MKGLYDEDGIDGPWEKRMASRNKPESACDDPLCLTCGPLRKTNRPGAPVDTGPANAEPTTPVRTCLIARDCDGEIKRLREELEEARERYDALADVAKACIATVEKERDDALADLGARHKETTP